MSNYLETIYPKSEYSEKDYPQFLCNHIVERYFSRNGNIENKKVLDIGSGKGNHLMGFARCGIIPHGLDKKSECIAVQSPFDIRECNIEYEPFPFKDGFFDCVFSKSVLEHVANTDNFLSESLRVLKRGGIAVLMTPDWRSQCRYFWDDYTHVKAFTRKSLQNAMLINGFQNVNCSYFLQLPIVWKHSWLKYFTKCVTLLPDSLKWKDSRERDFRTFIRFSKEKMLLAVGNKAKEEV